MHGRVGHLRRRLRRCCARVASSCARILIVFQFRERQQFVVQSLLRHQRTLFQAQTLQDLCRVEYTHVA